MQSDAVLSLQCYLLFQVWSSTKLGEGIRETAGLLDPGPASVNHAFRAALVIGQSKMSEQVM